MKNFIYYIITLFFIFNFSNNKVFASEKNSILNDHQIIVAKKYAERFCSSKADYFFEGLENEITLKYSYFKYIGLQNKEIFSKSMYKNLIQQIKEKCIIDNEEERELSNFFLERYDKSKKHNYQIN